MQWLLLFLLSVLSLSTDLQAEEAKAPRAGSAPAAIPAPPPSNFLVRHLQFLGAETVERFRYIDKAPGKVTDRDLQYRISTRVQVNLLGDGATYVQARGETGRNFTAGYDYTGVGRNPAYWSFNVKSLFVGQKIGHHWEAQAGGIESVSYTHLTLPTKRIV